MITQTNHTCVQHILSNDDLAGGSKTTDETLERNGKNGNFLNNLPGVYY